MRGQRRVNGGKTLALVHGPPYHRCTNVLSGLEFRILGQLEVIRENRALPLGSPKQRALLAYLLLHANELVPRERLIEELWGDAAPPTVSAVLNVYVSKLRRLFADGVGDEVLATQAPGYVLRVPAERLDAHVFEDLRDQGRQALANGDVQEAAATLHAALSLWRGPALVDLAYERFAQSEIGRLEELRLAALEDRIEAELALGRHDALVGELDALVAENPFRERLRAQLMLALYRSGRQAEALDAYQRARRTLVEELGIEPGTRLQELERGILRHDASLEAPAPASQASPAPGEQRPKLRARKRRLWTRVAFALAAGLVLAVMATVVAARRDSSTPDVLAGNSVAVIDPATNAPVGEIKLGGRPSGIAVGGGSVWVGNRDDRTLLRIDPRSRDVVRTIGLSMEPTELAVGAGGVWIASKPANAVLRVDPDVADVVATITLPAGTGTCCFPQIAVGRGAVWVSHFGALSRIDPATNTVTTNLAANVSSVAYGERSFWVLTGIEADVIGRIDPSGRAIVERISLNSVGSAGPGAGAVAAGEGAVWTANFYSETLWKIDPIGGRLSASVPLGRLMAGVAARDGAVWVAGTDGTVLRIDPESANVVKKIRLGVFPASAWGSIAVGEGAVWVATSRP